MLKRLLLLAGILAGLSAPALASIQSSHGRGYTSRLIISRDISPAASTRVDLQTSSATISSVGSGATAFGIFSTIFQNATDNNTGNSAHIAGGEFLISESTPGAATDAYGVIGRINTRSEYTSQGGAGTGVSYSAVVGQVFGTIDAASDSTYIGLHSRVQITDAVDGGGTAQSTGTVIDLYLQTGAGGAGGRRWAVYQEDSSHYNYFNGAIGLGNSAPQYTLHVGSGTDSVSQGPTAGIVVQNNGTTDLVVRDATNDAELIFRSGSSGGTFGMTTNHALAFYTNLAARFNIQADGDAALSSSGSTSPRWIVSSPATQTIAAGNTIAADACGTIKKITASGAVTTDTTNTFTAPAAANDSCCMDVIHVGTANNITLDANANFNAAADVVMTPCDSIRVCSDGTDWFPVSALVANTCN